MSDGNERVLGYKTAVVAADGTATVRLGPQRAFENWDVTRTTVQADDTALSPTCRVYRGVVGASALMEGTKSGRRDSSDTSYQLLSGESVVAYWTGATPGITCHLNLQGYIRRG